VWPWILLALAAVVAIAAYARSRSSKRAAAAALRQRGLDAYAEAMALRDEAAVLPMGTEAVRARLLSEVSTRLDAVAGSFDALAAEPGLQEASAEIGEVQMALGNLRGAIRAQVDAGGVDPDLLRERLTDLDGALQRFRARVSPPAPPPGP
jgi:hypothetical protein